MYKRYRNRIGIDKLANQTACSKQCRSKNQQQVGLVKIINKVNLMIVQSYIIELSFILYKKIRNNKMQHSQWQGSKSQKFQIGRRHIEAIDELGPGLQPNHYPKAQGLKTFLSKPTQQIQYSSTLRTFSDKYISDGKQIDLRGKKPLNLPQQIERKRPQLKHVKGGLQTFNQINLRGLKVYETANSTTNNQYQIEHKLQRKARILGLQGARNQIGVASMGDKPYKYPEYARDFYKNGGLIVGSTNTYHSKKSQFTIDQKKLKSIFTKPHWHQKVKIEQNNQQKKVVDSVDEWEQTILKQNNPNWKDPDTFFQRVQANQNAGGKDAKKGAKK